jgi:hypothetical protein
MLSPKKIPLPGKEIRLKTAQQFYQVTDLPNYIGAADRKYLYHNTMSSQFWVPLF